MARRTNQTSQILLPNKPSQPDQKPKKKRLDSNVALKYSGMAFQMLAIILIITFIGKKINDYFEVDPPLVTAAFALLSIFAALYLTLKDLIIGKK